MTKSSIIDTVKDEVIAFYNEGKSLQFLQDRYHIDRHTIRDRFKKWGVEFVGTSRYCGANSANWKGYGRISARYFSQVKSNAKTRNISFDLSIEEMWHKFVEQEEKCAISGIKLILTGDTHSHKTRADETASLDRIDNNKGYSADNIQWVHKTVNIMRNKLEMDEFIKLCHQISEHNKATVGV